MLAAALRLRAAPPPRRAAAAAFARRRPRASSSSSARTPATTTTMAAFPTAGPFFLDDFAARQWDDPAYAGTRVPPGALSKEEFTRRVAELHAGASGAPSSSPSPSPSSSQFPLVDGYAPFCKHLFIPNVLNAAVGSLPITESNRHLLRSGYTRRRPEELPVLTRWFCERDVAPLPTAKFLDVILYSREQLEKEYAAMPEGAKGGLKGKEALSTLPSEAAWGIISVKAQDEGHETPMQPITMLRNALGREEGGSGVALDRGAYEASAAYWDGHAAVVATETPSGE